MQAPSGEVHDVSGVYREFVPERETRFHLGLEIDARAQIAGHGR